MNKFASLGHPIDINHLYSLTGILSHIIRKIPVYHLKNMLIRLPAYKYNIMKVKSISGNEAEGYGIILPLLPGQFARLGEEKALEKVLAAVKHAERLGAKVVALGGFTSVVGNEGEFIARNVDIAVTSGNTFTSYLSLEGIYKACKKMEINLSNSTATVIGATGDIGSICSKILSKKVKKLYLIARNNNKLKEFANSIEKNASSKVFISKDVNKIIPISDIILTATTSIISLIDPLEIKTGAVVCDVSLPANVTKEVVSLRNDVLVFEGGLTKLPQNNNMKDKKFQQAILGKDCIFGCFGEAVLLALEGRYENFSLGRGNITEEKIQEVAQMSKKHGLEVSDFFCGYKVFSDQDIEEIKRNAIRKKDR